MIWAELLAVFVSAEVEFEGLVLVVLLAVFEVVFLDLVLHFDLLLLVVYFEAVLCLLTLFWRILRKIIRSHRLTTWLWRTRDAARTRLSFENTRRLW